MRDVQTGNLKNRALLLEEVIDKSFSLAREGNSPSGVGYKERGYRKEVIDKSFSLAREGNSPSGVGYKLDHVTFH